MTSSARTRRCDSPRFSRHASTRCRGGEYLAEEVDAQDSFPHTQSYEVVPVNDTSCDLVNNIKGSYQFPGSKYFGERIFRRYMPHILDDDNHVIAVGCGAIEPSEMKTPKGLLLWPLMTMATGRTKKSTRRDVLQEAQRRQGIEAAKQKLAEGRDDASGDD